MLPMEEQLDQSAPPTSREPQRLSRDDFYQEEQEDGALPGARQPRRPPSMCSYHQ